MVLRIDCKRRFELLTLIYLRGINRALNGIWFVGKAVLPSPDAKAIVQTMSHAYRFTEYKEISALTPSLSETLQTGGEYEILGNRSVVSFRNPTENEKSIESVEIAVSENVCL